MIVNLGYNKVNLDDLSIKDSKFLILNKDRLHKLKDEEIESLSQTVRDIVIALRAVDVEPQYEYKQTLLKLAKSKFNNASQMASATGINTTSFVPLYTTGRSNFTEDTLVKALTAMGYKLSIVPIDTPICEVQKFDPTPIIQYLENLYK